MGSNKVCNLCWHFKGGVASVNVHTAIVHSFPC